MDTNESNILEVLNYLFENFKVEEIKIGRNPEVLAFKLTAAGFPKSEIHQLVHWLKTLLESQSHEQDVSFRVYSPNECEKLDLECRGFLLFLEQLKVLNAVTREVVINHVMAVDTPKVTLEELKVIILMVLFRRPGQETAVAWMEKMFYEEMTGYLQ